LIRAGYLKICNKLDGQSQSSPEQMQFLSNFLSKSMRVDEGTTNKPLWENPLALASLSLALGACQKSERRSRKSSTQDCPEIVCPE